MATKATLALENDSGAAGLLPEWSGFAQAGQYFVPFLPASGAHGGNVGGVQRMFSALRAEYRQPIRQRNDPFEGVRVVS